jgi:hypothetical protein
LPPALRTPRRTSHRKSENRPPKRGDVHLTRQASFTRPTRCCEAVDAIPTVIGLTKTVALEGAEHGVTCNAICPGYVLTPLVEKQIPETAAARGISEAAVVRDVLPPRSRPGSS